MKRKAHPTPNPFLASLGCALVLVIGPQALAGPPTVSQTTSLAGTNTGALIVVNGVLIGTQDGEPSGKLTIAPVSADSFAVNGRIDARAAALAALQAARSQAQLDEIAEAIEQAVIRGDVSAATAVEVMVLVDEAAAAL